MFDSLLGFLVLTAGMWVPLAFVVAGVLAVVFVLRHSAGRRKKWIAGAITALVVILIPTWDVIAGRIYFNQLCARDSGIRILKRVRLDREFAGLQFPGNPAVYQDLPIAKRYPYGLNSAEDLPGPAKIKFSREFIRDASTGELLGTLTMYFYGGGWFENAITLAPGGGGGYCGAEAGGFPVLLQRIFQRSD